MPESTSTPSEPSAARGLAQAGLLYFEARARLFQIEAKDAGQQVTRMIVLAVCALCLLGGAWLLLMPVLVWWIAQAAGCAWHLVAAVAGGVHLVIAVVLVLWLKGAAARLKLFEETINQCRRDRECVGGSTTGGN